MNEVNDVQPTSLKHLESDSQKSMHEMVKVALDVSFQDSQRFPHASLVGSPGLGKSVLANVIASELCVPFKEVLGQTLRTPADLNALLLGATEKSIVFVDESDTLPIPIHPALYLALDKKMLFLSSGGSVQSLPPLLHAAIIGPEQPGRRAAPRPPSLANSCKSFGVWTLAQIHGHSGCFL